MRVHVLIPAAGRAARFGTGENKIFALLGGRPVVARTVDAFFGCDAVDTVTVVGRADEEFRLVSAITGGTGWPMRLEFCAGGETRQASVASGLRHLAASGAEPGDTVLVHDGARPLITQALIRRCAQAVREQGTAVAGLLVADTMKRALPRTLRVAQTVSRDDLWSAQTPQGATLGVLAAASEAAEREQFAATDESSLLERAGIQPLLVPGERSNIKITSQDDLAFAERLLADGGEAPASVPAIRVGIGYDIHQLAPGRRLVLGGVEIAHPGGLGLLGHSDADVLLHAICDALLGAAALPDIGHLFPNDDPRYAGADSVALLGAVRGAVAEAGYSVGNVDACVIAEQPKIAPHVDEMRRIIAATLRVSQTVVSVKATTNEKIGSLGAGEGIACHATALIMRTR